MAGAGGGRWPAQRQHVVSRCVQRRQRGRSQQNGGSAVGAARRAAWISPATRRRRRRWSRTGAAPIAGALRRDQASFLRWISRRGRRDRHQCPRPGRLRASGGAATLFAGQQHRPAAPSSATRPSRGSARRPRAASRISPMPRARSSATIDNQGAGPAGADRGIDGFFSGQARPRPMPRPDQLRRPRRRRRATSRRRRDDLRALLERRRGVDRQRRRRPGNRPLAASVEFTDTVERRERTGCRLLAGTGVRRRPGGYGHVQRAPRAQATAHFHASKARPSQSAGRRNGGTDPSSRAEPSAADAVVFHRRRDGCRRRAGRRRSPSLNSSVETGSDRARPRPQASFEGGRPEPTTSALRRHAQPIRGFNTTAGASHIVNHGGDFAAQGGQTIFEGSIAGTASIVNAGGAGSGGHTSFLDHASAFNATLVNQGGTSPGNGGSTRFSGFSSAGRATHHQPRRQLVRRRLHHLHRHRQRVGRHGGDRGPRLDVIDGRALRAAPATSSSPASSTADAATLIAEGANGGRQPANAGGLIRSSSGLAQGGTAPDRPRRRRATGGNGRRALDIGQISLGSACLSARSRAAARSLLGSRTDVRGRRELEGHHLRRLGPRRRPRPAASAGGLWVLSAPDRSRWPARAPTAATPSPRQQRHRAHANGKLWSPTPAARRPAAASGASSAAARSRAAASSPGR